MSFASSSRGTLCNFFSNSGSPGGANTAVNIPGFAYFGKTPFSVVNTIQDQSQVAGQLHLHARTAYVQDRRQHLRYIPVNILQGQLYGGGDSQYLRGIECYPDVSPALAGLPGFSPIQAYGLGIPQSFLLRALATRRRSTQSRRLARSCRIAGVRPAG